MIQVKHFYPDHLIDDAMHSALHRTRRHIMSGWPTISDAEIDHWVRVVMT